MKKGYFITFEGTDGCGKTTQIELVSKYLEEKNIPYVLTREPGATNLGKKFREILLHYDNFVADNCEVFVFLADRAQHIAEVVVPAINEGKIVLCDRHTDSHMAYQGYGRGGDLAKLKYLNDIAVDGTYPDLTFVFNVDLEVASKRVGDKKDRLEALGIEFHKKVQNGYLEIAKNEPDRVKVIDANKDIEEVFSQVKEHLDNLI